MTTTSKNLAVIILAAGKGTRMRSVMPKVLHPIADRAMVDHVIHLAASYEPAQICLVVGPEMDESDLQKRRAFFPKLDHIEQTERKGTGHAVQIGMQPIEDDIDRVVVLYGDIPLVQKSTFEQLATSSTGVSVAVFDAKDPAAYGRMLMNEANQPVGIVEFKDATEEQRKITLCNGGPMAFDANFLRANLSKLSDQNAQGELYLTDLIAMAAEQGLSTQAVVADQSELAGVNSRGEQAQVENSFQQLRRAEAMTAGVTLVNPDTVQFSADTQIENDVTIEPNVVFGPGVTVKSGARIRAFSHLEGAVVEPGAIVGPYARLRPGAQIGRGAKIGNFVEVKNAIFEDGAKANHLSYVGDAHVGAKANIGAGTITCNYDAYNKWQTKIGAGAFIGSNSALVAPVSVGDDAIVAAGTTLTKDLEADALGLTRANQKNLSGAAKTFKAQRAELKRKKTQTKA